MIQTTRPEGFETLTSMFLLIISAILIFGVLSFFQYGVDENNERDLIRLRDLQVKCLGEVLVDCYTVSLIDIESEGYCSDAAIIWDGRVQEMQVQGDVLVPMVLEQALETTPDGLTAVLTFGRGGLVGIEPAGEFVVWSHSVKDGTFFQVYLSIHAGSLYFGGIVE